MSGMGRPRKHDRDLPPRMYRRHGAYWYVRAGKWTRLGRDLRAALMEYARLSTGPAGAGSMPELIDRALPHLLHGVKPNTAAQYRRAAGRLKVIFAEFRPDEVRPRDVAAVKAHYADTPNATNRLLSVLRQVFTLAVEWQIVDANPCVGIRRHAERRRDRYLTDEEYRAIWQAASDSLRAIMDVAYLTGQRIGDVLAIRLNDIAQDGIAFRQQKTGQRLLVRMTPELKAAIERALALPRPVRAMTLFSTIRGARPYAYRTVRDMWDRACTKAGVQDAHLHDLRAKALTDAQRQGKDPQALGGHSNRAMTERYIRLRATIEATPPTPSFGQSAEILDKTARNARNNK